MIISNLYDFRDDVWAYPLVNFINDFNNKEMIFHESLYKRSANEISF